MTEQISFLPMMDDAEHPTRLLSGKPGMQNENGVYTENQKIRIGTGRPEWGAEPGKQYFVISWEA